MAVVMVGFVSAYDSVAKPPGDITLEAEMSTFNVVVCCTVILGTVLAQDVLCVLPAGVTALSDGIDGYTVMTTYIGRNEVFDTGKTVDYWLRL